MRRILRGARVAAGRLLCVTAALAVLTGYGLPVVLLAGLPAWCAPVAGVVVMGVIH